MTAALTRSYEKNSTVLSRSQNCCSVNEALQTSVAAARLFQHVGPDTAITPYVPIIITGDTAIAAFR